MAWKRSFFRDIAGNGAASLAAQVAQLALPIRGPSDLDPLIERIGDARYVLLGEASHGTSEYYTWRAAISTRLILEKGFDCIAVEGDWPDCQRIHRYVSGHHENGASAEDGATARDVLRRFERWPTWLWANEEVAAFVEWLRAHNGVRAGGEHVGFYGLDVYSLWESLYAVIGWLKEHQPTALPVARR